MTRPPEGTSPIYAIDVATFRDANGDGIGDLQGVVEKLDHVQRLGCGAIWLLPFYPSPNRDNGYDVSDYYGVDSRLGSFGDFVDLIAEARRRRMKVFIDLVINHSSDQHPWFRAAREHPDGPFRDYYIWNDAPPSLTDARQLQVFPDKVPGVWTWDEAVGSFFFHQFYPFQPSLNHEDPKVVDEVRRMINFWLELGVSGFRIDAAGHLGEPRHEPASDEAIELLRRYRSFVDHRNRDAILLGEADLDPDGLRRMMGPDKVQLLFDFIGNASLYLAFVRGSATPMVQVHQERDDPPDGSGWIRFLRNLDEVDLGRLTDEERDEVMTVMAPKPEMRIFKRGIRRRLAPMLNGDPRRLRLAFSLLCALPGVPMIVYGDEIGMGDDQSLPERKAVRTAMQWSAGHAAGFSEAADELLRVPVLRDGPFGAERVNVEAQEHDDGALIHFVRAVFKIWDEVRHARSGPTTVQAIADGCVLAICSGGPESDLVTLHNFSDRRVRFAPPWGGGRRTVAFGKIGGLEQDGEDRREEGREEGRELELEPYGLAWIRREGR